jgi:WD40 repeat protein
VYLKNIEIKITDNQNNKTMKTQVFSLIAIAALAFGTANFSHAATVKDGSKEVSTTLAEKARINKIEIRGNVEVFVSAGNDEKIKVYNNYYAENALVQNHNGTLRIASYNAEKLVVWVTAADLRNISVYDNAEVRSFGKLSAIELDVNLYDRATANLDLDNINASINVNDKAKANLSGNVDVCQLSYAATTAVNQSQLKAGRLTQSRKVYSQPANTDLAVL